MTEGTAGATPIGIFAKTFPGRSPRDVLASARDAGFQMVQYNMTCSGLSALPGVVPTEAIDELRAASDATGVTLAALSATYNMVHPDETVRRAGQVALVALAGTAHDVGIPLLTLCTGTRDAANQWAWHPENRSPATWRMLLSSLDAAIESTEQYDRMLGIEPEPANVVESAARAKALIDELGSSRVRIVFDAANLLDTATLLAGRNAIRSALEHALSEVAEHVVLVHAKDRTLDGVVVAAGRGAMDYDAYFDALAQSGVRAPIVTHGLDADAAPGVAAFLRDRISFVKHQPKRC